MQSQTFPLFIFHFENKNTTLSQSIIWVLFLFRLIKNFDFERIGMKVVVFLRHENANSKQTLKLKTLWLTKSQTAALLAALALTNAPWALFRKATSMSSTLIPALVAALAPALARTKQSLKTNWMKLNCIKSKKACQKQAFFGFFDSFEKFGKDFAYLCHVLWKKQI